MANQDFLLKVAEVLEAAAVHIDTIESQKIAADKEQKTSIINSLASKYAEATGDEMPDSIRNKLAASEGDIVDFMKQLLEKQAGNVEALGHASTRNDISAPKTVKEAAAKAEDAFLSWILE